jgi:hypothetical protein
MHLTALRAAGDRHDVGQTERAMGSTTEMGEIVLEGTWLYAGTIACRIAIVRRGTWFGTGDHEDPPEVAEDRDVETFEILYTAAGDPTRFSAGGGQCRTLKEAREAAEAACGTTVRWSEESISFL